MMFSVCFIERRESESPSIERVFRSVADNLEAEGVRTQFTQVPFGNGLMGTLFNLALFRPPKADLLHITGHVNYLGLVLPQNRTISTIHDLSVLNFRSGLRRWLIEKLYFVWPTRRLRFLTTISEETKTKLVRSSAIKPGKVRVIENPLLVSRNLQTRKFNESNTRILQIGTASNKNVDRLVEAISGLSCNLHIIGRISDDLRKKLENNGILYSNDEWLDDDAIESAYERADILTLCSTDEGFGLPIIEAQAKQTVVITSDRPPMREVAGGAAMLVEPENVDSIRSAIVRVISEPALRKDLQSNGLANVERFDPKRVASKYLKLYETILRDLGN